MAKRTKIKQKWPYVKRPNEKKSTSHPDATEMRPATSNITEGDWAGLSQSIKYLSNCMAKERYFSCFVPFLSGKLMGLLYGYIYGFVMVFASFKVCFFFFPCRYAYLDDILHFQLSLRGTPSFPGHQTPWMLMVQNLIFSKVFLIHFYPILAADPQENDSRWCYY